MAQVNVPPPPIGGFTEITERHLQQWRKSQDHFDKQKIEFYLPLVAFVFCVGGNIYPTASEVARVLRNTRLHSNLDTARLEDFLKTHLVQGRPRRNGDLTFNIESMSALHPGSCLELDNKKESK